MDLYYCQIVEGDLSTKLRYSTCPRATWGTSRSPACLERHEPDVGELNYPYLLALIDALGWDGWIGCITAPRAIPRRGSGGCGAWAMQRRRTLRDTRENDRLRRHSKRKQLLFYKHSLARSEPQ